MPGGPAAGLEGETSAADLPAVRLAFDVIPAYCFSGYQSLIKSTGYGNERNQDTQ